MHPSAFGRVICLLQVLPTYGTGIMGFSMGSCVLFGQCTLAVGGKKHRNSMNDGEVDMSDVATHGFSSVLYPWYRGDELYHPRGVV